MIRKECFAPADAWLVPTPDEISELINMIGPDLTGGKLAKLVGLGKGGGRTVRRRIGGDADIPYAVWCLMAYEAGLGKIWADFSG